VCRFGQYRAEALEPRLYHRFQQARPMWNQRNHGHAVGFLANPRRTVGKREMFKSRPPQQGYALRAYSVSDHLQPYSSFERIDTLAPVLECRITVAMMGWSRRSANVAKSRSNSR